MPADPTLYAYEHDGGWDVGVTCSAGPWPTREEAEAAIARHHAAVVESSPELARLRAELHEAEADRDSESARLRVELGRNVLPSEHNFVDDPHHTDQCRQHIICPGDVGRCCGYSQAEHREAQVAALRAELAEASTLVEQLEADHVRFCCGMVDQMAEIMSERDAALAEVAALRRERDELRAALVLVGEKLNTEFAQRYRGVHIADAFDIIVAALNPTGDDHG